MNKVLLTGRLTREPELRTLASGKSVTTFAIATNEYVGNGREKAEYHTVVTWARLAEICARYLNKGMLVAVEGRIQTRQWDDDKGTRHWKTEIVASAVEMLSGRRKADLAADALHAQATALGAAASDVPAFQPGDEAAGDGGSFVAHVADDDEDDDEAVRAAGEPEAEGALVGVG